MSRGTLHTTVAKIQYCLKFCLNQGTPGTPGLPGKRGRSGQDVGSLLVNLRLTSPHLRRLLQKTDSLFIFRRKCVEEADVFMCTILVLFVEI